MPMCSSHLCGHDVAVLYMIHQLLAAPQARVVDVATELHPPDAGLQRVEPSKC
jgi:hypothetical protein